MKDKKTSWRVKDNYNVKPKRNKVSKPKRSGKPVAPGTKVRKSYSPMQFNDENYKRHKY